MDNDYYKKAYGLIIKQLWGFNMNSEDSRIDSMEFVFIDPKKAFECDLFISNIYSYCDQNKIMFCHSKSGNGRVVCKARKK